MIRVNITYTATSGSRFDHDYYVTRHVPLFRRLLAGHGIGAVTVDQGLGSLVPGAPAAYTCVVSVAFDTIEQVQQGMAAHGAEILGDIPNFTDIQPVIQVSKALL
jgi:uncharacterized protein (TIGR02118 family)